MPKSRKFNFRMIYLLSFGTGILMFLMGIPIAYGGALLINLGGSFYYLPAGLVLVASGLLITFRRPVGAYLYMLLYVATWIWAIWEVGLDFWQLAPRIVAPTVLAILTLLCMALVDWKARSQGDGKAAPFQARLNRKSSLLGALALAIFLVIGGISALQPHNAHYGSVADANTSNTANGADSGDWTAYGRTHAGRRFVPFEQITKDNVAKLQVAWTVRTGDMATDLAVGENTPLQIGNRLITCGPTYVVNALDVETGKVLWRFDPHNTFSFPRCRSAGYYKVPTAAGAPTGGNPGPAPFCAERVVLSVGDGRLVELDLATGKPCTDFGRAGTVDLKEGLGKIVPNFYGVSSGPTVAGGLIIVGGMVADSADVDVPSGVVRAFDARSGKLRWFWDLGMAPDAQSPRNGVFTRGTPNVWAPISVDEELGLVYLPTGNPSPDHWGGLRTPAEEKFGSSVVALDLASGKVRWSFQTTHHDLWDYDVPSQPTLYDIPDGHGGRIPALFQPTKRGQIFVLDRRTGAPITPVEEKSVPRGFANGDRPSPTQPYSIGMPEISSGPLREKDMWGLSPLDQLWCRVKFRQMRYDGDFTPPGTDASLLYPGVFGGLNWGGLSIDETNDYLIVNDIRLPLTLALVPRAEVDRDGEKVLNRFGARKVDPNHGGLMLQKGTPFGALYFNFLSPLDVPCNAPPYGTLSAINLKTKKIAWQVPLGTTQDTGPLGIKSGMAMPLGLPTIGGSLVTKSGLIFFAGTQDHYLRAIDSSTGREVWKARLPVAAEATPMSYISTRSGRQFVVISASGSRETKVKGDYVIAYALPNPAR